MPLLGSCCFDDHPHVLQGLAQGERGALCMDAQKRGAPTHGSEDRHILLSTMQIYPLLSRRSNHNEC